MIFRAQPPLSLETHGIYWQGNQCSATSRLVNLPDRFRNQLAPHAPTSAEGLRSLFYGQPVRVVVHTQIFLATTTSCAAIRPRPLGAPHHLKVRTDAAAGALTEPPAGRGEGSAHDVTCIAPDAAPFGRIFCGMVR